MRRGVLPFLMLLAAEMFLPAHPLRAQQVVDRIIARIGDEIITLSELNELRSYQELVNEKPAGDQQLLEQLIEQWIVKMEAAAERFPQPGAADVDRALQQLGEQVGSPAAYQARLQHLGLTAAAVRSIVERQLYYARYLDYKFRPAVQVDMAEMEKYYREELVPALRAKGQAIPKLEAVEDQIRELLTQREISARAARWLDEARARLKIEISRSFAEGTPGAQQDLRK